MCLTQTRRTKRPALPCPSLRSELSTSKPLRSPRPSPDRVFRATSPPGTRLRLFSGAGRGPAKGCLLSKNLYVGNLSFQTTADDLIEVFGAHGPVTRAQVVSD